MFTIETKDYSHGKRWQQIKSRRVFATETLAWEFVEGLDQDGYRDIARFRVVPINP